MARTKQTARNQLRHLPNIQTGAQYRSAKARIHSQSEINSKLNSHDPNKEGQQWWKTGAELTQQPTLVKVTLNRIEHAQVATNNIQQILNGLPLQWNVEDITINGRATTSSSSSTSSSSASSFSSVHIYALQRESHLQTYFAFNDVPDTDVERPKKRQRLYEQQVVRRYTPVIEAKEDDSLASSSSSSSPPAAPASSSSLSSNKPIPKDFTSWYGPVIEEFLRACIAQPHVSDLVTLDPQRLVTKMLHSVHEPTPFIVALLTLHTQFEESGELLKEAYQPFRNQLKSLIRRAPTELTLKYGTVTPNCTLLQYVIYSWPINNTDHLAYDWLCGLLETPNYPIDAIDCHGESALSSWSRDERIINGLVFHKLVQAGARTDRLDKYDRSWMFHLLDLGQYNLIRSLIRHGYEHLCLDAFMQSSRESEFLNPHDSVWADRLDKEEKVYQSVEVLLAPTQPQQGLLQTRDDYFDDDQDPEERRLNHVQDEGPERVMVEMRRTWMQKYRPHIFGLLTSPSVASQNDGCGIISDCAQLCMQYLDGSGRPWVNQETKQKGLAFTISK